MALVNLVNLPEWFKPGALVAYAGASVTAEWVACHVLVSVRESAPLLVKGSLRGIFHHGKNDVMSERDMAATHKTMLILRLEDGVDADGAWRLFVEYHTSSGETVIGAYTPRNRDDKGCFSFGIRPL
jgi:hypothetical protein